MSKKKLRNRFTDEQEEDLDELESPDEPILDTMRVGMVIAEKGKHRYRVVSVGPDRLEAIRLGEDSIRAVSMWTRDEFESKRWAIVSQVLCRGDRGKLTWVEKEIDPARCPTVACRGVLTRVEAEQVVSGCVSYDTNPITEVFYCSVCGASYSRTYSWALRHYSQHRLA
jgi:hypothetical protein